MSVEKGQRSKIKPNSGHYGKTSRLKYSQILRYGWMQPGTCAVSHFGRNFLPAAVSVPAVAICLNSLRDHWRRQIVVRTLMTHSAIASCATFLFLPHFDVICDLLLNRSLTYALLWGNLDKELQSPFNFCPPFCLSELKVGAVNDFNFTVFHSITLFCSQFYIFALIFTILHWFGINWHALKQSECTYCCLYIIRPTREQFVIDIFSAVQI